MLEGSPPRLILAARKGEMHGPMPVRIGAREQDDMLLNSAALRHRWHKDQTTANRLRDIITLYHSISLQGRQPNSSPHTLPQITSHTS